MTEQEVGTFKCWLFGHKFIIQNYAPEDNIGLTPGWNGVFRRIVTDNCVRCGIKRKD